MKMLRGPFCQQCKAGREWKSWSEAFIEVLSCRDEVNGDDCRSISHPSAQYNLLYTLSEG